MDTEMKKYHADIIIDNSGTISELKENVNQFLKKIII
jgi:dephospho-CoA kinase